ncbi:MAG: STAS-like domain-containing protein [Planctomycetales bacterium]|nr:STAS-like domain-containing protein [Planctomycetales bacterium]MCP5202161.1 STAS-like domain-containing protein [Gammaproteobacteria bacterium]
MSSGLVSIYQHVGERAENKDFARAVRTEIILPALAKEEEVCLDFAHVRMATQSFIHACISEAIRKYGNAALMLLEFRKCNTALQAIIATVVEYSMRFGAGELREHLQHNEIPQADNLTKVREVVRAVSGGSTSRASIAASTGYSLRHVDYRLAAARILGLLEADAFALTRSGYDLLSKRPGSEDERHCLLNLVEESKVYRLVVPDLLETPPPSLDEIARRIQTHTTLGVSTAIRRASTLMSWRRYVGSAQLSLWPLEPQP